MSKDEAPVANTPDHETLMSKCAKQMAAGAMDLAAHQVNHLIARIDEQSQQNDPLSLERWIHNAEALINMADRLWDLGEKSYDKSVHLMTHPSPKMRK